jgi:hypothetical protein
METENLSYLEAVKRVLDDIEGEIQRKKREREERRELRRKERELPEVKSTTIDVQKNQRLLNRSKYWEVEQLIQKTNDFGNLMKANIEFAKQLADKFSLPEDLVIVTNENAEEVLDDIKNHGISRTYIIVTAVFSYNLGYRKYTRFNKDGEALELYYGDGSHPAEYSPRLDIFSTEYEKSYDIFSKLLDICNNVFTLKVPIDGNENYLLINTKLDGSDVPKSLSESKDTVHAAIRMTKSPFFVCYEEYNQIKSDSMRRYRELQRAWFYAVIIDMISKIIKDELRNYKDIFETKSGFLDNLLAPKRSEAYKKLKFNLLCKQPFSSELVDETFPWLSLLYRGLPNDLINWAPVEKISAIVDQVMDDYKKKRTEICNRYSVPQKVDARNILLTDFPENMHEKIPLEFIFVKLVDDLDQPMSEIVDSYKNAVEELARKEEAKIKALNEASEQRSYRETDDAYHETRSYREMDDDYYEPRRERSSSFARDVAAAAIGGSIANRGIKKELRRQTEELERQRREEDRRRRREEVDRQVKESSERRRRELEESKRRREESLRESIKRNEEQKRRWKEEQERLDRMRRRGR